MPDIPSRRTRRVLLSLLNELSLRPPCFTLQDVTVVILSMVSLTLSVGSEWVRRVHVLGVFFNKFDQGSVTYGVDLFLYFFPVSHVSVPWGYSSKCLGLYTRTDNFLSSELNDDFFTCTDSCICILLNVYREWGYVRPSCPTWVAVVESNQKRGS